MRCAVAPGRLEPEHGVALGVDGEPLVADGRACDVAAQFFNALPVMGLQVHELEVAYSIPVSRRI